MVGWGPEVVWVPAEDAVDDSGNSSLTYIGSCIPWIDTWLWKAEGEALQTMVIIRAIMHVIPEKQKEVIQTLLSLINRPEMGEGCLSNGIFSDIEDGNAFSLISEWETRQHLEKFLRSDGFSVLLGTKSLLSEPLKIDILTVSNSEGVEAVDLVRTTSNSFPLRTAERRLVS